LRTRLANNEGVGITERGAVEGALREIEMAPGAGASMGAWQFDYNLTPHLALVLPKGYKRTYHAVTMGLIRVTFSSFGGVKLLVV